MEFSTPAVTGVSNPSGVVTFNQADQRQASIRQILNPRYVSLATWITPFLVLAIVGSVERRVEVNLVSAKGPSGFISNMPDLGVTRELQPGGSYKWFAIDPETGMRVEIDPDQAWYWTPEWQAGEREADNDLREGRFQIVDDLDDFFNNL